MAKKRDSRTSAPTALETPKSSPRHVESSTGPDAQVDAEPRAETDAIADSNLGDDRFTIEGEIARGGMGRVLRARDDHLGRTVAIKEMLATSKPHERRFEREVEITARLQHPSILPLYDSRRWDSGEPYYVMRLVSGTPLSDAIKECQTLNERLALVPSILAAADAMAFAHAEGIIHRDIKPANILVGEHGETVLIDWGIAKFLASDDDDNELIDSDGREKAPEPGATMPGAILGTAGYMPPEQAVGDPVDKRADVYALGATLYHLIAGEPPFGGADSTRLVAKQLASPPVPITKRAPGTPGDLSAIVDKALAPKADERYVDAAALAADLRRFTTGRLVAAHDYSFWQRAARFLRRHRGAAAIAIVALATLGVVLATSIIRVRAENRAAVEARAEAERRADELMVARAATLAERDPTAAAALLKRLPLTSPSYDRVREVFRQARALGIANKLRGGGRQGIAWLSDTVLVSADFGTIWLHDVSDPAETDSTIIFKAAESIASFAVTASGTVAIVDDSATLTLYDRASRRLSKVALPQRCRVVRASKDADTVVWHAKDGRFGTVDVSALKAIELGKTDGAVSLTVSADGRRFGASGDTRSVVSIDGQLINAPENLIRTAFSRRGERIVAIDRRARQLVELKKDGNELVIIRRHQFDLSPGFAIFDGSGRLITQIVDGRLYVVLTKRVRLIDQSSVMTQLVPTETGFILLQHEHVELIDSGRRLIPLPRGGEGAVNSALSASYIAVGTGRNEIFVWRRNEVLPRSHHGPILDQYAMVSSSTAFGVQRNGHLVEIDLRTGARTKVTEIDPYGALAPNPTNDIAIWQLLDRVKLIRLSDGKVVPPEPFLAEIAISTAPGQIVFARKNQLFRWHPFEEPEPSLVDNFEGEILAIAASATGELFTATKAGELARGLGDERITIRAPGVVTTVPFAYVGGIVFGSDRDLYKWSAREDDPPIKLATVERPLHSVYTRKNGREIYGLADGVVYRYADGEVIAVAVPKLALGPLFGFAAPLGFGITGNRRPTLVSFDRRQSWLLGTYDIAVRTIGAASEQTIFTTVLGDGRIDVYDLRVPETRADLRMAIERSTTATVGDDFEALVWPADRARSEEDGRDHLDE